MEKTLSIKPYFRTVVVAGKGVFLLRENTFRFLEGASVAHLAQGLLDGCTTLTALQQHLKVVLTPTAVQSMLAQLERDGILWEPVPDMSPERAAFWLNQNIDPHLAAQVLKRSGVKLCSLGPDTDALTVMFDALGIQVCHGAGSGETSLDVILVHDFLHPALSAVNREALRKRRAWLLVKPGGGRAWWTLFVPGRTACWACLAKRLQANRPAATFVQDVLIQALPPAPSVDPFPVDSSPVFRRIALESARWLIPGATSSQEGALMTLDPITLESEQHRVNRLPHCQACGVPPAPSQPPSPVMLSPHIPSKTPGNGSRIMTARKALRKHAHLVDPLTGVVRSVHRMPVGSQDLIHSYVVPHPLLSRIDSLPRLKAATTHVSGGKGKTRDQARASALFEAIERLSGIWREDLPRIIATYEELGTEAIHPHDLLLFSERQYETRATWNASCPGRMLYVPEPYRSDTRIAWVAAWSLTHHTHRYVPAAYAFYDVRDPGTRFCEANSNGCAAGVVLEEAVLQATYELFEREDVSTWWLNRVRRPGLDLASFDDPYVDALIAHYQTLGREIWVLDVTGDRDVPVFAAISRQRMGPPAWLLGFGCHLEAGVALSRALTEVNQMLPTVQAGSRGASSQQIGLPWAGTVTLEEHPYLGPDASQGTKTAASYPVLSKGDLLQDILYLKDRLQALDLELLVLDQTHPDIGVPVARVMVPGLRHYWRRLGGERLYHIPVTLGWFSSPCAEEEMNPLPLML